MDTAMDQPQTKTLDQISIRNLHLRCIIGIQDWERKVLQDVLVNVVLFADLKKAGLSDAIEQTINYKTLCKAMINLTESSSFFLVEALAERLATLCLEDDRVQKVRITVEKPTALRFTQSVGVTIERDQVSDCG